MRRLFLAVLLLTLLVGGTAGCGSKDTPVPVKGTVLLDGQALDGAMVTFTPVAEGGQAATGMTGDDGVFNLINSDGRYGALPGNYKVTVSRTESVASIAGEMPKSGADADRMMMQGRGKNRQGAPQASQKKQGPTVHARYRGPDTPLRQTVPPDGEVVIHLNSKGS